MKKGFSVVAIFLIGCLMLSACGVSQQGSTTQVPTDTQPIHLIKIPDVRDVDMDTAKTLLAGKGLIPRVVYEYSNDYDYGMVIRTEPEIGSQVEEDTAVTVYVCGGYKDYELSDAVGYMKNVTGIDAFSWGDNGKTQTKAFYAPRAKEGYLYIDMWLACTSDDPLAFYGDFGTASINDTFDKTVPMEVIYDNKTVDNTGKRTYFTVKIPLSDLNVQKPTNIYVKFDFTVDGVRQTFEAGFDLSW